MSPGRNRVGLVAVYALTSIECSSFRHARSDPYRSSRARISGAQERVAFQGPVKVATVPPVKSSRMVAVPAIVFGPVMVPVLTHGPAEASKVNAIELLVRDSSSRSVVPAKLLLVCWLPPITQLMLFPPPAVTLPVSTPPASEKLSLTLSTLHTAFAPLASAMLHSQSPERPCCGGLSDSVGLSLPPQPEDTVSSASARPDVTASERDRSHMMSSSRRCTAALA